MACTNKVCVGADADASCTDTYDCKSELYCDKAAGATTGTCKTQLAKDATCTSQDQCPMNYFCSYTDTTSTQAKCTKAKSIDNKKDFKIFTGVLGGAISTNIYQSWVCEDLIAYSTSGSTTATCIERPKLTKSKTCTLSSDCPLTIKDITSPAVATTTCACSHNSKLESYCSPGPGDSAWDDFYDLVSSYLSHDWSGKCNNGRKVSEGCEQTRGTSDLKKWIAKQQYAAYYVAIKHSPDCYAEAVFPVYWDEEGSGASYLFAALALLIFA